MNKFRPGLLSTSYRRRLLDKDLERVSAQLRGVIVDLGGEWQLRRGTFQPPKHSDLHWLCLNLSIAVAPDVLCDVAQVPLADSCADAVMCTEVLEHVPNPQAVLAEAYRLLKPGGTLIVSIPFMMKVHGDPYDYQRYTDTKLKVILTETGFNHIIITSEGSYFTILADLIRDGLTQIHLTALRWGLASILLPLLNWLVRYEQRLVPSAFIASYVAGYFITAYKPNSHT